jgi:hypothetical protein
MSNHPLLRKSDSLKQGRKYEFHMADGSKVSGTYRRPVGLNHEIAVKRNDDPDDINTDVVDVKGDDVVRHYRTK